VRWQNKVILWSITQYGPFYLFVIQWYNLQNIHINFGGVNTFKLNTRHCTSMCVSDFRGMQSILHALLSWQLVANTQAMPSQVEALFCLYMIDLVRATGVLWVTCWSNQGLDFNFCFSPLALPAKQIKKKNQFGENFESVTIHCYLLTIYSESWHKCLAWSCLSMQQVQSHHKINNRKGESIRKC